MPSASTSIRSHAGHDLATDHLPQTPTPTPTPHGLAMSGDELARLPFETFAGTLRQELAPSSLLEGVLAGRVVTAAWRLHLVSLDETEIVHGRRASVSINEGRAAHRGLKDALALLESGRRAAKPGRGRPRLQDAPAPEPTPTEAPADFHDFDDETANYSNEWTQLPEGPRDVADARDDAPGVPVRWQDRLVFDFNVSETSPVVKGTWVTVGHVVSLIVDGWTWPDVLRAHPELTEDDVRTCLAYTVAQDDRGEV